MKNPELILYRAALGQIMADAGITRSTIQEMVREIIREKVDKQFAYIAAEEVRKYAFKNRVYDEMQNAIRSAVRKELDNVKINIKVETDV